MMLEEMLDRIAVPINRPALPILTEDQIAKKWRDMRMTERRGPMDTKPTNINSGEAARELRITETLNALRKVGPMRVVDIGREVGVAPDTARKYCEGLVVRGLVVGPVDFFYSAVEIGEQENDG